MRAASEALLRELDKTIVERSKESKYKKCLLHKISFQTQKKCDLYRERKTFLLK